MFGQEPTEEDVKQATDGRGVIAKSMADRLRAIRASEQWERYDSIVIGPGAAARSRGWFNTWFDFVNAAAGGGLQWFAGRDSAVGQSYSNITSERADWAQDLHQTLIEFIPPIGIAGVDEDQNDSEITPLLFSHDLPNQLAIRVILADADEIAKAPASHFPSGFGLSYPSVTAAAAPVVFGGNQGEPHVSNGWKWPDMVMLAAKSKIAVQGLIDDPLQTLFRTLPGPGNKLIPDGAGGTITMPNWYVIKITHRGPRYLQIRGARSSA